MPSIRVFQNDKASSQNEKVFYLLPEVSKAGHLQCLAPPAFQAINRVAGTFGMPFGLIQLYGKEKRYTGCHRYYSDLANCAGLRIPGGDEITLIQLNLYYMLSLILIATGLICFRLFFKSIDWFEKI